MLQATTEIPEQQAGGIPQLNVLEDGSYTNQIAWLVLTFAFLYFVVSKLVLPRVATALEGREEKIAADLDAAETLRGEADEVRTSYEKAVADARAQAQKTIQAAKDKAAADIASEQAKLDEKLAEAASAAEGRINDAKKQSLAELETIAVDVASDIVSRLAQTPSSDSDISKAVKAAMTAKGA